MKLFEKPQLMKLGRLVKEILNAICSICYICKDEILNMINELLEVLKSYVDEHVLAEKFARFILETVANLYYSKIITKLSPEQIVNILDICIQVGWRNAFYTIDQTVFPLFEYLKNPSVFSMRTLISPLETSTLEPTPAEKKVIAQISQLTYPAGETGRKFQEEADAKLKVKTRPIDVSAIHFGYQQDNNIIMHLAMENIIHFYLALEKPLQAAILPFFSRLSALEIADEQSPILNQTLILYELISWYSQTNLERMNKDSLSMETGKLWLLNEYLKNIYIV